MKTKCFRVLYEENYTKLTIHIKSEHLVLNSFKSVQKNCFKSFFEKNKNKINK